MTYANLWTYECPIFAETEMNQHFGDNGQLCRSLHKNMTQKYTIGARQGNHITEAAASSTSNSHQPAAATSARSTSQPAAPASQQHTSTYQQLASSTKLAQQQACNS
jgi:hypothetical protein